MLFKLDMVTTHKGAAKNMNSYNINLYFCSVAILKILGEKLKKNINK